MASVIDFISSGNRKDASLEAKFDEALVILKRKNKLDTKLEGNPILFWAIHRKTFLKTFQI